MRVRRALVLATLVLTMLPLVMLTSAWLYERWLTGVYGSRLRAAATSLLAGPDEHAVRAAECGAQISDSSGHVTWDSHTEARAIHPSFMGGAIEWVVERLLPGDPQPERWETIAPLVAQSPPGLTTLVTPSGESLVLVERLQRADGGTIIAVAVSRRGLRRLISLHHDLAKLMLYQVVLSFGFAVLLGRWLVRPLEALTEAARAYPARPLAGDLATRGDEIGELARSFVSLADALESRRRAAVELGADVAHEFKNPLATIAASAELLDSPRELDSARRALIAEQVGHAVERLRAALDRMQELLRLEVELPNEPKVRVELAALVEDVLTAYRTDPRCAGWTFTAHVTGALVLVPDRWRELLSNLVENALVQPTERREIVVTAGAIGDEHVTSVRDFGPGVSAGNRDKIFQRFFSQRPANAASGTGLGLSIVAAIAAAHGGRVTLDDVDGPGAQLSVRLPHDSHI